MEVSNTIGYVAAIFLSILFIPQVVKTYRTKNVQGISLIFLILEVITCILFITYGILIKDIPVIVANCTALLCNILLIVAKLTFNKINNDSLDNNV